MSVRSRTAGVMTTLMRNGRDRRLGKPVMGHAILERMLLVGTRSADHIRASSHSGCIAMEAKAKQTACELRDRLLQRCWNHQRTPSAYRCARRLLFR